jgi:hypothetical protein
MIERGSDDLPDHVRGIASDAEQKERGRSTTPQPDETRISAPAQTPVNPS